MTWLAGYGPLLYRRSWMVSVMLSTITVSVRTTESFFPVEFHQTLHFLCIENMVVKMGYFMLTEKSSKNS